MRQENKTTVQISTIEESLRNIPLKILTEPNEILHMTSEYVDGVDDALKHLMDRMLVTLHEAQGIGLAAVQVGVLKRVIVIDLTKNKHGASGDVTDVNTKISTDKTNETFIGSSVNSQVGNNNELATTVHEQNPLFMVNAKIVETSEECGEYSEGCLSVPEVHTNVIRPLRIKVEYLDYWGNPQKLEASHNLLAVCIQHEIDHTNGIVIIDYMSKLKRDITLKKLQKNSRNC